MSLVTQHVIGLAAIGEDLAFARLAIGQRGVRVIKSGRLSEFIEQPDRLREELGLAGKSVRVIFVCDGAWCAARPMPISCAQWFGARDEVLQSLDRMLPYSGDQAYVGLVEQRDGDNHALAAGGRLVAIRRSSVDPWLRAIERAIGRRPDLTLAPEMAMLGLGLQDRADTIVVHMCGPSPVAHRLARGVPIAMGQRPDPSTVDAVVMPGAPGATLDGVDAAIAGALAERVAPDCFRALEGASPSRTLRWIPTLAAIVLAGAAFGAAGPVRDMRTERAIDQLQSQRDALVDEFNELQRTRAQTERLQRLLRAQESVTDDWVSVLPALRDAIDALPEGSLLYRVQIRDGALELTGEAPAVRTVLERLTENERIASAELTAPPTRSPSDESLEVFAIRAVWTEGGRR
jgi:hypothetical protein